MKRLMPLLLLLPMLLVGPALAGNAQDPRPAESRQIVQQFMMELKSALMQTMEQSGPVAAIGVCKGLAPAIATRLSQEYGATVGRTSLKLRNPANAPDEWQRNVLEDFEARRASGEKPRDIQHFEVMQDGSARYMKAIGTQPLCLTCHGRNLKPEIQEALRSHYPDDQATGFRQGDIRGAFRIDWPAAQREANE